MAENAANFTFTFQNKPSIFEIIAQKSLNDTLHPALQKIALFLANNFPQKFNWLNKYYEEAFLVLNGLLQYHYLKYYDASFSENFYGLKRVVADNGKLTKRHKELSLIFLVALPYFKRKMEEKIAVIRIENAEGYLRQDLEGMLKKLVLFSHSTVEVGWGIILLHNYLKYMSNQTEVQTPILNLIDVKLTYSLDQQDIPSFWSALFKGNLSISELSFGLVKNALTTFLEVTAFFLQFLQSWNTHKSNFNFTDLPLVPPPPVDNKAKNYRNKCPICLKPWLIPTVLPVSGYIFCFRCILRHLSENQCCPVTNLPAKPLDIVRLYVS
ncbi:peroxisome assembly protein 12 [Anoplophora glabripennis]|uniref:peroxisome assembly protein 12 n=1 Tax=Anoplophora glabripennis TaxID=217634 RepID=UPI0008741412|nr:peroxisome assembly protein 12 [Anoplophora glabripennis]